ncbi:hypothetical protein ACLKA7_014232 [Drosophila subpalustris]
MICWSDQLICGLAVLSMVWSCFSAAEILECYKCFEAAGTMDRKPLPECSKLRDSPEYKVQCPNSTMCLKEEHTIHLLNGMKWTTETRDCASQVNVVQVLRGRIFEDVAVIEEPYSVGCLERESHSMLTATVKQCYCRGNLCNTTSHRVNLNSLIKIIYVMFLLSNLRLITARLNGITLCSNPREMCLRT